MSSRHPRTYRSSRHRYSRSFRHCIGLLVILDILGVLRTSGHFEDFSAPTMFGTVYAK